VSHIWDNSLKAVNKATPMVFVSNTPQLDYGYAVTLVTQSLSIGMNTVMPRHPSYPNLDYTKGFLLSYQ
jgi:hypothetical protein